MRDFSNFLAKVWMVFISLFYMFIFFEIWFVKIPDIRINGMVGGLSLKRLFFNLENLNTLYERNHQHFKIFFTVGVLAEILIVICMIMYFQSNRRNEWRGKMFD